MQQTQSSPGQAESAPIRPGFGVMTWAAFAATVAAPVLLVGCGGGGGGGGGGGASAPTAANTFTKMTISGTTTATMTVNGIVATAGSVEFSLNNPGASLGLSLKREPGASQPGKDYAFTMLANDGMGSTDEKWVQVTINEAPEQVLDMSTAQVKQVRLFHSRLGMGATVGDLARFRHTPYNTMIDTLLAEVRSTPVQSPPSWRGETIPTWSEFSSWPQAQRDAYEDQKGERIGELRRWWFKEMLTTSSPLTERMVLFWHNHFVTAVYDIFQPITSLTYLETLRTHAMGNFKAFVEAICIDPAMVMFLSNNSNKKGKPNENFARELMELFTLGEGQIYTEADIVQVARAFTGFGLTDRDLFQFKPTDHDDGNSGYGPYLAYLGLPGGTHRYGAPGPGVPAGPTVVDRLFELEDPNHAGYKRVAIYIAEKLWDEFVGGTRDTTTLRAIAGAFQTAWSIPAALATLFKSATFKDVLRAGYMIRSPIELFITMYHSLEILPQTTDQWNALVWMGDGADQQLGQPPNVRGWLGGNAWITTKNYMNRRTYVADWKFGEIRTLVPAYLAPVLKTLLLPIDPVVENPVLTNPISDWSTSPLRACLRDPAIHLK